MTTIIDIGRDAAGTAIGIDLEELLATRLLVQGNSGSGKSHLLRRLLEGSAAHVQQVVVDPEGDFVSLNEAFGHVAIEASAYSTPEIMRMALRVREHRASVVLSLEGLELEAQMRCAAAFLSALFEAPREHWYPALVVVDEAQLFAPAVAGEVSDEARRMSLGAMTNLMCRGRKRGLAGVIATQRLAKLAKNVAAEASNFLMGRTFLDIDMQRAADLLGMERRQAEVIRDLERGEFLSLGPAVSRRAIRVRIGEVRTAARSSSPTLIPLPDHQPAQWGELLLTGLDQGELPGLPEPVPQPAADDLIERIAIPAPPPNAVPTLPVLDDTALQAAISAALDGIAAEAASAFRQPAELYQDFLVRCRMSGLASPPLDLTTFRRRLLMARAGVANDDEDWSEAIALASLLPEEMLGVFLLIARAARERLECPSDAALAEVYGTSSLGRVRRMLEHMESRNVIVTRIDLAGKRSVSLPHLGWTTTAAFPDPGQPSRLARPARRS